MDKGKRKAKIGIIGCGQIVKLRHAPELKACPFAEPAGFYDFHRERAEEYAGKYGGKVYDTYQQMIMDPEVDGVVVCTANDAHAPISIEALEAGKCVLCEKPMSTTLEDARRIVKADQESSGFFMAAHNQRFNLAHTTAKAILDRGEMGKVLSFRCTLAHEGPERYSVNRSNSTWYLKKSSSGLGCISDLGIHKCDILMHLLGEPFVKIGAMAGTRDKKDENGNPADVYDNAVCIMETASGVIGTLNLSYTNYSGMENATVYYCEKGVLRIDSDPKCVLQVIMDGGVTSCYRDVENPNSGVMNAFARAIVNKEESPVSAEEALKAMEVVFAIEETSRKRGFVELK